VTPRHPNADSLDAYAAHLADMGVPLDPGDAAEVLDAWHRLDVTGGAFHDDLAECVGLIGVDGRCGDCGRLVLVGAWRLRSHQDGGCLLAIPLVGTGVWLWQNKLAIPLVGQAIYRRRRRRVVERGLPATWNGQHG